MKPPHRLPTSGRGHVRYRHDRLLAIDVTLSVDRDGAARVAVTEFGDQVEIGVDGRLATALLAERRPPPYRMTPDAFPVGRHPRTRPR